MTDAVKVGFVPFSTAPRGTVVVLTDETLKFGRRSAKALGSAGETVKRAVAAAKFKGKSRSVLEILAPAGVNSDCLLVVGTGAAGKLKDDDFLRVGGIAAGRVKPGLEEISVIAELPRGAVK